MDLVNRVQNGINAGAAIGTAAHTGYELYNSLSEGAQTVADIILPKKRKLDEIEGASMGADSCAKGVLKEKAIGAGGMGSSSAGGMNYSVGRSFVTNGSYIESVNKRHVLSTSVLLGQDGKKNGVSAAGKNNTFYSAVNLPLNMWEFWMGDNTSEEPANSNTFLLSVLFITDSRLFKKSSILVSFKLLESA